MNSNDEKIKTISDKFSRLSFMLELTMKLLITGDHPEMLPDLLSACEKDADELCEAITVVYTEVHGKQIMKHEQI